MTDASSAFKAIADPTRREILRLLRQGEMSAGDIAAHFDITKPTMSHHFSVLADADLISRRREGQTIWFSVNTSVLEDLVAWTLDLVNKKEPS
ncbi:MAG TPA: autorepressor SdpR family transcription factor [Telluria sp.]|nr:autorepressor SdpR family transcription factor [Telluria sp.]